MISVVVITHNSTSTIKNCLESLRVQTSLPEIIVVDSNSTDDTLNIARQTEGVRIFSMYQNFSKGAARNTGIRVSSNPVVAFLDSDCVAPPNWTSIIETSIKNKPAIGGPYYPAQPTPYALSSYRSLGTILGGTTAQFRRREDPPTFVKALPAGNCAFIKDLLEEVNGFNETPGISEDSVLGSRIRNTGRKLVFIPEMWVYHRWSGWNSLREIATIGYKWGRYKRQTARSL